MLIEAQRADQTLSRGVEAAVELTDLSEHPVAYYFEDDVLMRKWSPRHAENDWSTVFQVVVPKPYREQALRVAHDHELSGHVDIRKTYDHLMKHFFWPSMKSDVAKFFKSCHACQIAGKANQVVPPAPLKPIPVLGEPFEQILIDCVGPLPKTKSGNSYLLTLMCVSTRFPEAIPLRSLKAHAIVKAIVKFCTTFGRPKCIQSDQGTNFMSRVFATVMKQLNIKHQVSSAYHPQSQGAIERFHQTLKSMLCTFCVEHEKEWDEHIPLLLFAVRNTTQTSLGFSPSELVFVRGPLKMLQEQILPSSCPSSTTNVLDYVSAFRERLHTVWKLAKHSLSLFAMPVATVVPVTVSLSECSPESDGLKMNSALFLSASLPNSETLLNLAENMSHLAVSAQADISKLIGKYPTLFKDKWRCWFHFPAGLGTCPHCQRYQNLVQWAWCYCVWLASKLTWPEPRESRWETPDPTMQMTWRPLSEQPGLHYTWAVPQTDRLHAMPQRQNILTFFMIFFFFWCTCMYVCIYMCVFLLYLYINTYVICLYCIFIIYTIYKIKMNYNFFICIARSCTEFDSFLTL